MAKYQEQSVGELEEVLRKGGVQVGDKTLTYASTQGVSLRCHGIMDFLVKHSGYTRTITDRPSLWNVAGK